MGSQNLHKTRSHLKIRGATNVTGSGFHSQDLRMLGATEQNLVVQTTWRRRFLYLYSRAPLHCHV